MSTTDDEALIGRFTRTCQIISVALIAGVTIFYGIATTIRVTPLPPPGPAAGGPAVAGDAAVPRQELDAGQLLTWLAVGFAAIDLPLSIIVPGLMTRQSRRAIAAGKWNAPPSPGRIGASDSDTVKLAVVYQTQLIVGSALNEGAAFFAGIAYMIGRDPIALGAGILLIAALIARFPTTHRVALWIARQQELLFLDRGAAI